MSYFYNHQQSSMKAFGKASQNQYYIIEKKHINYCCTHVPTWNFKMAKFGISSILRVDVLASTIRGQQLRLNFNYYKNACNTWEWKMGGASGMVGRCCVIWALQMLVDLMLIDLYWCPYLFFLNWSSFLN